jgi:hypothetical protein
MVAQGPVLGITASFLAKPEPSLVDIAIVRVQIEQLP